MELENKIRQLRLAMLLSLLFCTVLAWVINQQGQTIERQRDTIRTLYQDTIELNRRKVEDLQRSMRNKVPIAVQKNANSADAKDALPGCLPGAVCG